MKNKYKNEIENMNRTARSKSKKALLIVLILFFILLIIFLCTIMGKSTAKTEKTNNTSNTLNVSSTSSSENKKGYITDDPLLTLVNYQNKLPENWTVDLVELSNGNSIDKRAYPDLQKMIDDAQKLGYEPLICSSYRTEKKQNKLYNKKVSSLMKKGYSKSKAQKRARNWVSRPNTSEHQLGLALDIVSVSEQRLNSVQENSPTQKWLMKNSWKYGFILRYPKNKYHITGVKFEPWHYRFVSKKHAKEMHNKNLCLEEYILYINNQQ